MSNVTDAKSFARSLGRTYARSRFKGRAKNGKGRLFGTGGAKWAALMMGAPVMFTADFESTARETWRELQAGKR